MVNFMNENTHLFLDKFKIKNVTDS